MLLCFKSQENGWSGFLFLCSKYLELRNAWYLSPPKWSQSTVSFQHTTLHMYTLQKRLQRRHTWWANVTVIDRGENVRHPSGPESTISLNWFRILTVSSGFKLTISDVWASPMFWYLTFCLSLAHLMIHTTRGPRHLSANPLPAYRTHLILLTSSFIDTIQYTHQFPYPVFIYVCTAALRQCP